jgi:hypothetical protein
MADITWDDDVVALAPDLEELQIEAQTLILAYVNRALNPAMFKSEAALTLARIYLAAHLGTNAMPGSGGEVMGTVVSEKVGDLQRTYGAVAEASEGGGFESTTYGKTFQFLVRTSRARLPRVI